MNKKYLLLLLLTIFCLNRGFSQGGASVTVDPLTGQGTVVIPIYTMSSGQVSVPVSLVYSGSGVKPKDVEGSAGMNWNLVAGGQITRQVRGLPDDVSQDTSGQQRLGWMNKYDIAADTIAGFIIQNNGTTCSYETADNAYITAHFPYWLDTEPDIFTVNAPGLSCQMVYNRADSSFKPLTYQDLKIKYIRTSGKLTSFTITNNRGITYVFDWYNTVLKKAVQGSKGHAVYFKNQYLQYQNGIIYSDTWALTNIYDANGNGVSISNTQQPQTMGSDSVAVYVGGSTTSSLQYFVTTTTKPSLPTSLYTYSPYGNSLYDMNIHWTTLTQLHSTGQTVVSQILVGNHNFNFTYSPVAYSPTGFVRSFLRSFADNMPDGTTNGSPVNFQFGYIGETIVSLSGLAANYTTILPDSTSLQRDYWGYYSTNASSTSLIPKVWMPGGVASAPRYAIYIPATNTNTYVYSSAQGVSRVADPTNAMAGSLNKITYISGGSTNIVYESNDYIDAPSNAYVQGGGIRVKQIIDSVANGTTNNIVKNYSYKNPSTGSTSGVPVSLPQYAFTVPYTGSAQGESLLDASTAISAYDLSNDDHTILYAYSSVSQTGTGSTQYQFYVPATYWSASATPDCSGCNTQEWAPTVDYFGRNNCLITYGVVFNGLDSYPFVPNANYDFERGQPLKVSNYTDNGTEVSESNYTYKRSYTPSVITAFKYENNASLDGTQTSTGYNKYKIFYNTSELTATVISKMFDSQLATSQSDTTTYTYGGTNHKLVTQIQKSNSDGSILTSHFKYVKDFSAVSGTNPNVTAIYNLAQENLNAPVESYQQVQRAGVTKTISADLTLFTGNTFGSTTLYLPSRHYKMIQPDGLTTFVPMTISGQTLTFDSTHYIRTANFDTYDNAGYPLTVDDNFKNKVTTLFNHLVNQPIAIFKNAGYNEIAFSDFDSDSPSPKYGFIISGNNIYSQVAGHAGNGVGLPITDTVTSPTLTKNTLAANYIFSIWINPATAGTLTLTVPGVSPAPTISYTNKGWQYYELKIPAKNIPASFVISFIASNNISIDDILLYPDVAEAITSTYDPVSHYVLAVTNTNGVSSYFNHDAWGRITYQYDQDHNIVKKNTYVTSGEVKDFGNLSIHINTLTTLYPNTPVAFGIFGVDVNSGATVSWNFGDGTSPVTTSLNTSPTHTYTLFGTYTVTATVNSPVFGSKTVTTSAVITPANIALSFINSLPTGTGNMTSIQFQQGGVTKHSFMPSTISGATVPQGNYTIVLTISNPVHHTNFSAGILADCWQVCSVYTSATTLTYTYTANLSTCTTLQVSLNSTTTCPGPM